MTHIEDIAKTGDVVVRVNNHGRHDLSPSLLHHDCSVREPMQCPRVDAEPRATDLHGWIFCCKRKGGR